MRKPKLPAWAVLTLIALCAALLLGATYELTKTAIANQEIEKASATRRELLPAAVTFDELAAEGGLASLFEGKDAEGNIVGYVATTLVSGYGGEIEINVGMDQSGVLNGIRVGGSNFSETPGLGAKAKETAFTQQFEGLTAPITLNEDVDAITSATITSNAVVRGVNNAVSETAAIAGFGGSNNLESGIAASGGYYAIADGFGGPVYVEITLDDNGAITAIVIGDETFHETPNYGQKAQDPAFHEQFIGLSGTITLNETVDAISGATITSTAVVDAVNAALETANSDIAVGQTESGRYYAVSDGFAGPVYVEIAVDANGAISDILIGDESFKESPGYGQRAQEPAFYEQFIGLSGDLMLKQDVDAISGATITSEAVVKSVNMALARANGQRIVLTEAGASPDADTTASATVSSSAASDADTTASATTASAEPADADTTASATTAAEEPAATDAPADADTTASATTTAEEPAATDAPADADTTASATTTAEEPAATDAPADADTTASATTTAEEPAVTDAPADADTTASATTTAEEPAATDAPADADTTASATTTAEEPAATDAPADADTTASATTTAEEPAATDAPADADTTASATTSAGDMPIETGVTAEGHYYAAVKGYKNMVYVEITLDDNGAISSILIGDERFSETENLGQKVQEPAFYEQFIGLTGPFALNEQIDCVTGATITSQAVIDAVNAALALAK